VPGRRTSAAQQAHGHRRCIDHSNPLIFYKQIKRFKLKTAKEIIDSNYPFNLSYMRLEEIERLPEK
jgi:hypothetical protein